MTSMTADILLTITSQRQQMNRRYAVFLTYRPAGITFLHAGTKPSQCRYQSYPHNVISGCQRSTVIYGFRVTSSCEVAERSDWPGFQRRDVTIHTFRSPRIPHAPTSVNNRENTYVAKTDLSSTGSATEISRLHSRLSAYLLAGISQTIKPTPAVFAPTLS